MKISNKLLIDSLSRCIDTYHKKRYKKKEFVKKNGELVTFEIFKTKNKEILFCTTYRGTKKFRGWINNFDMWPIHKKYGMFDGFYDDMCELVGDVIKHVKQAQEIACKMGYKFIWISEGHSRGGAHAQNVPFVALMDNINNFYTLPNYIITHDAPRSLTEEGVKLYNDYYLDQRTVHVIVDGSVVNKLPPKKLFGTKFKRTAIKNIIILKNKKGRWNPLRFILDHRPEIELKLLKKRGNYKHEL